MSDQPRAEKPQTKEGRRVLKRQPKRSARAVAEELEAMLRDEDAETDPQRKAVLWGRCSDLGRELDRAAMWEYDHEDE